MEWNAPLYINFIDYTKAFDSVHQESLWKIIRAYGIPPKIVKLIKKFEKNFKNLIEKFCEHFECSIILDDKMTESFEVRSGLWQGCILSPLLFLITIDWVMCQTTSDHSRGIQWTPFSHLEDLDFADDLAVISATYTHIKKKTNRLSRYAKQVGLHINKQKMQTMRINALVSDPVNIEGEPAEDVNDFTYLGSVISTDNRAQKDIKA